MKVGRTELFVVSVPVREMPVSLTGAERAVAQHAVRGLSNADIARVRRTSVRTVANQMSSVLAKLKVGSRGELAAALLGQPTSRP